MIIQTVNYQCTVADDEVLGSVYHQLHIPQSTKLATFRCFNIRVIPFLPLSHLNSYVCISQQGHTCAFTLSILVPGIMLVFHQEDHEISYLNAAVEL